MQKSKHVKIMGLLRNEEKHTSNSNATVKEIISH